MFWIVNQEQINASEYWLVLSKKCHKIDGAFAVGVPNLYYQKIHT